MDLLETALTECPRCGYDQRGFMQQWQETCPLLSPCTECGFAIDWRDLLNPKHSMPMWHVEYCKGPIPLLMSLVRSPLALLLPWYFWRKLKAAHRPVWPSIIHYLIVHTLFVYLCWGLISCLWIYIDNRYTATQWYAQYYHSATFTDYFTILLAPWHASQHAFSYRMQEAIYALTLAWILMPVLSALSCAAFASLPTTRRKYQVRWPHIIRINMLHLPICHYIMLFAFIALFITETAKFKLGAIALPIIWALLLWFNGHHACKHYLKMPHAAAVSFCMVLISSLATAVLGVFGTIYLMLMDAL